MPAQSHMEETTTDDGTKAQKLVVEFSNGSLQQLQDLAKFFDIDENDPYKVIEMAIGFLESVKERAMVKMKDKLPKD